MKEEGEKKRIKKKKTFKIKQKRREIMEKANVYFTKEVSKESLVKMYEMLEVQLPGKVAVKLHSGEQGNRNYLKPEFVEELVNHVHGTVVECNTAYPGARNTTEKHKKLMDEHEWTKYFDVDIMDCEGPDMELEIPNGKQIKKNYVGKHLANYDSMVVLSHFKGHAMGGFGGALKQLSIGCASSYGKAYIHGAGHPDQDMFKTDQLQFVTSMGDAASSVHKYFNGKIVYLNAMVNLSVDCDCDGNASAPCMENIGILASTDPVAIDQACVDLIYQSKDPGKEKLIARMEEKLGAHIIEVAEENGAGTREYELISVDEQ